MRTDRCRQTKRRSFLLQRDVTRSSYVVRGKTVYHPRLFFKSAVRLNLITELLLISVWHRPVIMFVYSSEQNCTMSRGQLTRSAFTILPPCECYAALVKDDACSNCILICYSQSHLKKSEVLDSV